jgi:hypothetical protein
MKCKNCWREAEYPHEEYIYCLEHYEEAVEAQKENDRINARDAELEERRMR